MSDKVYGILTQRVIEMLGEPEQANGFPPWQKEWSGVTSPMNHLSGKMYQGVNALMLILASLSKGFASNRWMTLKQANAKGGKVKKNTKGFPVIFFKVQNLERINEDTGEILEKRQYSVVRYSLVFNLDQIEGVATPPIIESEGGDEPLTLSREALLAYMRAEGIGLVQGGGKAAYSPVRDRIQMPEGFTSEAAYTAALAHECMHSTGHAKRLNRFGAEGSNQQFAKEHRYPFEELVAELGALFFMSRNDLTYSLENHVSYLKFWVDAMRVEPRFLVRAASRAEKALAYLFESVGKAALENAQQNHQLSLKEGAV
ncbi:zincin-like metallopeptidase domain-containing protein [uncultured Microbulbifer sp.]|uniref:ArdC family protein n=1 Tax=uncultured Microbulbifer sp. TaxID=348147 RepID=UPI0026177E89|nr:zincin-like metallopeptidase domain-containing protein [uncultured Microbulbifer sp.]